MNCSHSHHHPLPTRRSASENIGRLALVLLLTGLYMLVEFAGGLWANSLALLADAGHMLADVGAVGLALFAAWFSEHPASPQRTYGYYRLEILAALVNGIALAALSLYIIYEAIQRFYAPSAVQGEILIWIAVGGLLINLISMMVLYSPGQQNLNIRAAFAHILSDSLGSVATILAGLIVFYFGFYQADAILSVLIALLVLVNAWKLIGEATNILLEACPVHLNVAEIKAALLEMPEIESLHDLHVWSIASGKDALSVHVLVREVHHFHAQLITDIQRMLKERFGLTHITIQLEPPDFEEDEIHF